MLDVPLLRARFATGLELSDRKDTHSALSHPTPPPKAGGCNDACSHVPHSSPRREGRAGKCNAGALHSQAAITFESVLPWP